MQFNRGARICKHTYGMYLDGKWYALIEINKRGLFLNRGNKVAR